MNGSPLPLPLPDPPLADEVVALRAWRTADAAVLAAAWCDPDVARWTAAPAGTSVDDARRWIATEPDRRSRGDALDLVVTHRGVPVGEVGITRFDPARSAAELGWWTAPGHRGAGYASRSVRLLSRWAVTELCIERVYARVDPRNPASAGVARSAGLELRGRASDGLEVWSHRAARAGAGANLPL